MGPPKLVMGQVVRKDTVALARKLRRQMTAEEQLLWAVLRRNGLDGHHFRRQQIVDRFVVDFYYHAAGLVIEIDGPVHDEQAERDRMREEELRQYGLRIMRVRSDDIHRDLPGDPVPLQWD